jgi:acyl-CoA thioesterase FadM
MREARANLFHALGIDELDLGDGKTAVVTADVVVNYRSEGFMFDALRIESHIDEVGPEGFRVYHRMTHDGRIVALAEVGLVGFDYATRAHVPIPETFREALRREEHRGAVQG